MKVAICYDRINKWGGAEQVLLNLHEIYPTAELFTSVYDEYKAPWAKVFPKINTSFLQKIPFLRSRHQLLGLFMPIAFESFNFKDFDLVISVTSESAKGIITKPPTRHVCIMLTPTRYLWSHYQEYFKNPLLKVLSYPVIIYLRWWDRIAVQRPDRIISISSTVKKRIEKYYRRVSDTIFPPVDVTYLKSEKVSNKYTVMLPFDNYFLVVSRLVPYKKVDLAINTFNKLGRNLIIVGIGSEEFRLKNISKNNIFFTGFLDKPDLIKLYKNAEALIMPQEEDFGIVSIEAQALGCPVIAYAKGGSLDTVIDEKTGILFKKQSVSGIVDAVKRFDRMKFNTKNLIANAQRFSKESFNRLLLNEIKKL